jgi:hypothetical protein
MLWSSPRTNVQFAHHPTRVRGTASRKRPSCGARPDPPMHHTPLLQSPPRAALWLRSQSCQPRSPGQRLFDRAIAPDPWQRDLPCVDTPTFKDAPRKTRRDPFAASSMTAQSRCSSTSLPPWMAHNRPAPPGCARGRARRHPNRLAAFQPNSAARPAQFSPPVKKLLQSLKNWRHRCGGMSVSGRWLRRQCQQRLPAFQKPSSPMVEKSAPPSDEQ